MSTDDEQKALQKAQARRLRAAREHAHIPTARAAAAWLRVKDATYIQHENGTRSLKGAAPDYAAKFGVNEEWLLWGKNPPDWAQPGDSGDEGQSAAEHFIRQWREFRRLSEHDLADAVGVPIDLLQAWEAGVSDVSGKWLVRLAGKLDATPGSLLDIDPRAVPPGVLEMWRSAAASQRQVHKALSDLQRTGTDG